ncbi:MAG: hypothetical protein ACI9GZ_003474, partial [Bacteroidia bacterium]
SLYSLLDASSAGSLSLISPIYTWSVLLTFSVFASHPAITHYASKQ